MLIFRAVSLSTVAGCGRKLKKQGKNRSNWSRKEGNFYKLTGKEDKWFLLLCVGGKNRASDPNFGEKTASRFRSVSKQLCKALTSSIASCEKHLKTPPKRWNRPNGQQKPGNASIFSSFHSQNVKCYFIARFYPSLFFVPYNALYSAQIPNGQKCNTTPRTLGSHVLTRCAWSIPRIMSLERLCSHA